MNEINGILIVDKDAGMTSHDVVRFIRKKFAIKKVGHAGTLDPNATGVLVLLLGKATKLSDKFLTQDKEYTAVMKLGERTDSGDSDGNVISAGEVIASDEDIRRTISGFLGETKQVPPMVSAKRVNGERLYKLARKGIVVERKPQTINITEIETEKIEKPFVEIRVVCGKGTYIRQLADDIGEKLECGAHLTELRRTRSGEFSIDQAVSLDELSGMNREQLNENITRIQER